MSSLDYLELGGTLFIPASHKHLNAIVNEKKYPKLRSLVIDFEDGLEQSAFTSAMKSLGGVLARRVSQKPYLFLRARDEVHLKELLQLQDITNITGFVLAKFSLKNADEYLSLMQKSNSLMMPSIEGEELFNHQKLHRLKEKLLTHKEHIVLVRFGLEDMLRQLTMRRECDESIFDRSATSAVVGNFIATFKSAGFGVSGGVYPCFKDAQGFLNDVKRDMREGLFGKTIIHPNQIEPINECYRVSKRELEEAQEISDSQLKLFSLNGKMAEVPTMFSHSRSILKRAEIYGVSP